MNSEGSDEKPKQHKSAAVSTGQSVTQHTKAQRDDSTRGMLTTQAYARLCQRVRDHVFRHPTP